jgi:hypothetical protein
MVTLFALQERPLRNTRERASQYMHSDYIFSRNGDNVFTLHTVHFKHQYYTRSITQLYKVLIDQQYWPPAILSVF